MNAVASPAPMTAEEARAAAFAHMARDMAEPDDAPEPDTFARPWRPMPVRGDIVPTWDNLAPVRVDLEKACAALLVAVDSGQAPAGPMPQPRYHGRPGPRPVVVAPLPTIPELVDGADAAARRDVIDRVAPLLRAAGELATLLDTAPPDVAARARRALARATCQKNR